MIGIGRCNVGLFERCAAGIRNCAYDAGSYLLTKRRLKNPNDSDQQQKDNPNPHRLSHHKPPERRSTGVQAQWSSAIGYLLYSRTLITVKKKMAQGNNIFR